MKYCLLLSLLFLSSSVAFLPSHSFGHGKFVTSTRSWDVATRESANTVLLKLTASETSPEENADLDLLQASLTSSQSNDSASKLLEKLREMRGNDMNDSVDYLNNLLKEGPDRRLPLWATLLPLTRFSQRARLASLKRTLDLTTPPPEDDAVEITEADQLRRRRRALVSLLQTLSSNDSTANSGSSVAIRTLEKKARRAQSTSNKEDMLSRRPAELETPKYDIVVETPAYEVRAYDSFSVCTVAMNQARPADSYKTDATISDPKMAGARAFGALAGYLFGKNQQESAMKMTTPVLTSNYESDDNKQMSFVLPSDYWKEDTLATAPQPLEGSGVTLSTQPASNRAVAMFGGYAAKAQVEKQKKALLAALSKDSKWEMVPDDQVALAQYNDPFTPPWKRLNEVSVLVQPIST